MYFLHEWLINHALDVYKSKKFDTAGEGDWFFNTFGPGNTVEHKDRPFERFSDYEMLLAKLNDTDHNKFRLMHKGTPYYFLAWTAFDLHNFEKALFYMDAAISEDIRKDEQNWLDSPATQVLVLNKKVSQVAQRTVNHITEVLENELDRFNKISTTNNISLNDFLNQFVCVLLSNKANLYCTPFVKKDLSWNYDS